MIDFATKTNKSATYTDEQVNAKFLELMPLIKGIAHAAFRDYDKDRREDAVQSVLVGAFINVKQLAEQGRLEDAYATPIAWFSISAIRTGRTPGVSQSSKDVMNSRCRFLGRAKVLNAGLADHIADTFESEANAVDARYPVHKTVQLRIDFFQNWYKSQSPRDQEAMKMLAYGESTGDVAKHFGVSPGAVSQWRRRFSDSWNAFINPVEEVDFVEELKALAVEMDSPTN